MRKNLEQFLRLFKTIEKKELLALLLRVEMMRSQWIEVKPESG